MKVGLILQCPICLSDWRFVWFYSVQYVWVISDRCGWDLSQKYWACTHVRLISSQERKIVILAYDDSAMLSVVWVSCRLLIKGTLGVYWCRSHYLTLESSQERAVISRESVWIQTDFMAYWEIVMLSNSGSVVLWWIKLFLWMGGHVLPIEGLFPMDHFRPLRNCVNEWDLTKDISVQEMCNWRKVL